MFGAESCSTLANLPSVSNTRQVKLVLSSLFSAEDCVSFNEV